LRAAVQAARAANMPKDNIERAIKKSQGNIDNSYEFSRYEGFGFPILEAMSYNKPVICSSAGSLSEIAGDAALIFKTGNVQDLKLKIESLYNDRNNHLRNKLIKNGSRRIKSFNWDNCIQKMYEMFIENLKFNY